jgi:hypothetical protein
MKKQYDGRMGHNRGRKVRDLSMLTAAELCNACGLHDEDPTSYAKHDLF